MFFHVDESGNTGNNLFDANQPRLSYGVISSPLNIDALGTPTHTRILKTLGVDSIHANQLKTDQLVKIIPQLYALQKKFDFRFDYYYIDKQTYALVILFDSIFDAGLNDAVKWEFYWTPLRFVAVHNFSRICDEELLRGAWKLCTSRSIEKHADEIVALLRELRTRAIASDLDDRTKELFCAALDFGIKNPLSLDFGTADSKIISPNAVGFQFVLSSIARRLRAKKQKDARQIKIDKQSQFNPAQIGTHYVQSRISEGLKELRGMERRAYVAHPLFEGFDDDETLRKGMPKRKPEVWNSADSIGLQVVDTYLWLVNRMVDGRKLPEPLQAFAAMFLNHSCIDSISMEGMASRWHDFERQLPKFEDLTTEQLKLAQDSISKHRDKVRSLSL